MKSKAKNKHTTLTIVQDFPKKPVDKPPTSVEMVQHKGKDFKIDNEEGHKTTLTIVQEFPKK